MIDLEVQANWCGLPFWLSSQPPFFREFSSSRGTGVYCDQYQFHGSDRITFLVGLKVRSPCLFHGLWLCLICPPCLSSKGSCCLARSKVEQRVELCMGRGLAGDLSPAKVLQGRCTEGSA